MSKWLSDSYNTGATIMNNIASFKYDYKQMEKCGEVFIYKFTWDYHGQTGYISINYMDTKISNSSLIGTDEYTDNKFGRPLGLYNDGTLYDLFALMMQSINLTVSGIYSENFN